MMMMMMMMIIIIIIKIIIIMIIMIINPVKSDIFEVENPLEGGPNLQKLQKKKQQ